MDILDELREKCPWDRKQTNESLRPNTIEETYELCDALIRDDKNDICKELGDVLLHVVFYAKIGSEKGDFDMKDVCDHLCEKLIFRHPHVFGDVTVSGSGEVLQNWEELKKREKHQTTAADSVDSVARSLPGLWRAEKIQKKAAKVGFDWPDVSGALEKLREEAGELEEAVREDTNVAEELGDLLFAAVNVARFVKVDPEDALSVACDKFARRFRQVEASAAAQGKTLDEMTLAEMDRLWDEAKKQEA